LTILANKISWYTLWILLLVLTGYHLQYKLWKHPNRIITSDVLGYYAYLPATVIHRNDIYLDFIKEDIEFYKNKIWFLTSPTGKRVIPYTCGLAMLYSPFFLVFHGLASKLGYEANGYTEPYKIALIISCLVYMVIGLYFLRKILLQFFSEAITAITLFAVVVGTNLLFYTTFEAPMSHAYSFALMTGFVYGVFLWYKRPTYRTSIVLGLLAGIITLVRPTNIVILIPFVLWGVTSFKSLKERIIFFFKSYRQLFLIALFSFLVWIPQMLYWKAVSGTYLYNSYGDQAWFFFNDPEILNVLFSYRKGWLLYTPIMVIALAGIPLLYRYARSAFWLVLIFTLINIYVISSWWDWWYGGSFGLRAFIDSYGILALPMAAFFSWTLTWNKWIRYAGILALIVLIYHNTFQITQFNNGAIHWASMTKKAYWDSFGRRTPSDQFNQYLEFPDYKGARERVRKIKEQRAKSKSQI
jgi:hypothetical protein